MLAQGQSSSEKRRGLALDVSSGLIFLTHTHQKKHYLDFPRSFEFVYKFQNQLVNFHTHTPCWYFSLDDIDYIA